jgi:hypothetical protein
MFSSMPIFFYLVFALVIGIIVLNIVKGIQTWNYNNAQPVLSVPAKVTSRRTDVSSYIHNAAGDNAINHHHTNTTYFVTFEVESGDRMEFQVADNEYGMVAENDIGKLTFQGTRYLGFVREK